ncbi:MAG TPA: bacteriohopanetetrol glucosamine biosynthesis glycosyltransferase HpnI [Terriglobales bacterium]|nr:bacteriohopanetetrol glucosamine biosynthesis glycosyltransferase HpnI [Terriglobales bacterium]
MLHPFLRIVETLTAAAAVSSIAYYVLCLWSAAAFLRDAAASNDSRRSQPVAPVSILKPLRGTDVEMYENFRSHCLQDYPAYEILFGVSDPADPAIPWVERLQAEFPRHAIRLIHCPEELGTNIKVSTLVQMLPHAQNAYIIVNDSDIRVPPDYLRSVLASLVRPQVGLVTCPYRGIANPTLGSRLESLGISTDFFPGVLVARTLETFRFALGSTLAFHRRHLEAVGGFEAFLDYLADDYQMGASIAALGLSVVLSSVTVDSYLPHYTRRSFFDHQLRWARTIRDSRYWGYLGLGATFGLPWALVTVVLAGGALWAWIVLAVAALLRAAVAIRIGRSVLRDHQVVRWLAWLPLRDVLALGVWLQSFAGHTVAWRGVSYTLKNGKLAGMPSHK